MPTKKRTVLVVDDYLEFREMLSYQLEALDYDVVACANGQEALERIRVAPPDLVLLDAMMPKMDGFTVLRHLREEHGTRTLPVIMLTALEQREHRVAALEAGADGFLSKPVDELELQAKIRALLKLKDAYKEIESQKAQFLAMLIHDMRSPLTSLGMFLDLLSEQIPGPLNEEQRSIVESCATSTGKLLGLVNKVLDFSKLEAGQLQPRREPVPVATIIRSPWENALVQARHREVRLLSDVQDEATHLNVDQTLIEQVITNLLDNAIKATGPGGTVTLQGSREGERYALAIKDTGSGIPADLLQAIFQPYVQVTKEGKPTGSGLGLTVSRLIVEAHQSELHAESEVGVGSAFRFALPIAPR